LNVFYKSASLSISLFALSAGAIVPAGDARSFAKYNIEEWRHWLSQNVALYAWRVVRPDNIGTHYSRELMKSIEKFLARKRVAIPLGLAAAVLVVLLASAGYIAVREWQRSVLFLADRQVEGTAARFLLELSRDLPGAQRRILLSPDVDAFTSPMLPADYAEQAVPLVTNGFEHYSYLDAFFLWRRDLGGSPSFFFPQNRRPPWSASANYPKDLAIIVDHKSPVGSLVLDAISKGNKLSRHFVVAEQTIAGTPYQIIARLIYRDPQHQSADWIFGFMVDLNQARQHYFSELLAQSPAIGEARDAVAISIVDDAGLELAHTKLTANPSKHSVERQFQPLFLDPIFLAPAQQPTQRFPTWTIRATALEDSWLMSAARSANRMLILEIIAAAMLGAGILLSLRGLGVIFEVSELRSDFVASVTHEFKTPIATIRAAGDTLAADRIKNAAERREYARYIVQEARRLTRLVDNLLAFSRVTDTTNFKPVVDDVALKQLVSDTLDRFSVQLNVSDFQVEVLIPEDLPLVLGDPSALDLMLDNIIDNAIRHSRNERRIQIRADTRDGMVALDITDRGGGIAADEVTLVTKKFYRGKQAGHGGTGLGLAIASRIATEHGGKLKVISEANVGTTIHIELQARRGVDSPADRRVPLRSER
jgi:signal transduction histidine kinase